MYLNEEIVFVNQIIFNRKLSMVNYLYVPLMLYSFLPLNQLKMISFLLLLSRLPV